MDNSKPYLGLTIGDNVQHSTLREQVLQCNRSQQKWATSMVASSSTDYQGPMPMDIDRVQGAKGKGKKGKNDHQKGKGKDAKEKEITKEKKVITRAQVKVKTRKVKVWQHVTLLEGQDILRKTVGGTIFDRQQATTHTVNNVSQQSSSAETKPVRRIVK